MKQLFIVIGFLTTGGVFAQQPENDSVRVVAKEQVAAFLTDYWGAYNSCDIAKLLASESENIEFYHDKGGLDVGRAKSKEAWEQFCGNSDWRVNAEWDGTYEISPMFSRDVLYGAMVIGNLKFYATQVADNHKEFIGTSRYVVFVNYSENTWKMHRVFSFDHQ